MTKQVAQDGGALDLDAIERRNESDALAIGCSACDGTGDAVPERSAYRAERASRHDDMRALVAETRRLRDALNVLCKVARRAVNGIEPMAASVDDLLCDLKRAARAGEAVLPRDAATCEHVTCDDCPCPCHVGALGAPEASS